MSSSTTTTSTTFVTGVQYGFFFDQSRCYNCHTCTLACRNWYGIQPGPVKLIRVFRWEKGAFPSIRLFSAAVPCYHCENPVCVSSANGAMFKEPKYGAVLIDPSKANDPALRAAASACPYGCIQFDSDAPDATASKCTMCVGRLENGLLPVCVLSCPSRAMDFGTLDDLKTRYGANQQLEDFPDPSFVKPALVVKPRREKKTLIPYDTNEALGLLASRTPLPPVFSSSTDVTEIPSGLVGTDHLVLKASSVEESLELTKNDMG